MLRPMDLRKAFTFFESGPVLVVSSHDGQKDNLMTISWSMVNDFTPRIALTTGPWNTSFKGMLKSKECVLAVLPARLLKTAVGIGTCHSNEVDKWEKFKLTKQTAKIVQAPLIQESVACLECKLVRYLAADNIFIWQGEKLWANPRLSQAKIAHANGDGTFFADGQFYNLRREMKKLLRPTQYRF